MPLRPKRKHIIKLYVTCQTNNIFFALQYGPFNESYNNNTATKGTDTNLYLAHENLVDSATGYKLPISYLTWWIMTRPLFATFSWARYTDIMTQTYPVIKRCAVKQTLSNAGRLWIDVMVGIPPPTPSSKRGGEGASTLTHTLSHTNNYLM